MTRQSFSTLVNLTHQQMLPSQPQSGKRKPEDFNPLLNAAAAKRAKKELKVGAPTKRKLNNDDGPSSLLVVRASEAQPSHSQPVHTNQADLAPPRFSSQPSLTSTAGPSKPPTKKFKADSQSSNRGRATSQAKTANRDRVASSAYYDDAAVERDVRAMEDEADHLRRNSRAHTAIDSSLVAETSLQFQSQRPEGSGTARSKGKMKIVDISTPLPDNDTPRAERNKQLRQPAMDAIAQSRGRPVEANGASGQGHRRKSSISGRGKRISSSFEATGIITHPHTSVSESSFYKHIDCDLPEPERIRQLLIWCSLRATATPASSSSLPPLSAEGVQILKTVQDDIVRMLAEKRVDLSLHSSNATQPPPENLRENEQNVRNRKWEITYASHIQEAEAEEEAWKRVSYGYDAYSKKLQASLEKRAASLQPDQQGLSAKAKGKRRAAGEEPPDVESQLFPHEHELPPQFHPALALARSVLGHHAQGDDRIAGGGRRGMTRSGLNREELEAEIKSRMPGLEFKVDQIYTFANAARATTNIAEKALNERFDVLSANLASRTRPILSSGDSGGTEGSAQLISTYVAGSSVSTVPDPLDIMRALSRVDQSRPPAQVGDAARRAAREVQRAEKESGYAPVGEKKLTGVPATPRKTPGTPRRGNTPGRER
ncbi:unnamed protein product [Cyclocybe aegerita]|uniref:Uncharacterized protein n=1 Tax=Cyclocybe aegerita TaxID=1973307 RepID=A0A8S0WS32_CYCAE|nr:unnamed protein product [Cyclocybe aegerita]